MDRAVGMGAMMGGMGSGMVARQIPAFRWAQVRWVYPIFAVLGMAAAGLALVLIGSRMGIGTAGSETSAATIALGSALYGDHCATCHGAKLEGQPDWMSPLPSGRMPAPPHDAFGHTWHHPDGVLFRITKEGPAAVVAGDYQSDMPAFANTLSDEEIKAVLAFIKSTWPERERAYQAEMGRREREETQ